MSERKSEATKVEDLEKPITEKNAEAVKGGAGDVSTGAGIITKTLRPRGIIPCV